MKNEYKKERHTHHLPPCPAYDVEGMERWLSDMAHKGLFLTKDGFFAGVATFEYGSARSAKYRLEAAQKSTSMWSENGGEPDPEQVELSERYSWSYIAKRGDFYISDAVKIIIAVVLGALLLAALTLIFNDTVIPRITQEINGLFS